MSSITDTIAVIFNGGKGRRLSELTNGTLPKGFIQFNNKPLIAYQIEALKNAGVVSILIVLSTTEDENYIRDYLSQNKYEGIEINTLIMEFTPINGYTSPYISFKNPVIFDKIRDRNVLTINSDSLFRSKDLVKVIEEGYQKNSTVITLFQKPAKNNPFDIVDNKVVNLKEDMFYDDSNITGITYYRKEDLDNLKSIMMNVEKPHVHEAVKSLIENNRSIYALWLSYYLNMNTLMEYNQAIEYINSNPIW